MGLLFFSPFVADDTPVCPLSSVLCPLTSGFCFVDRGFCGCTSSPNPSICPCQGTSQVRRPPGHYPEPQPGHADREKKRRASAQICLGASGRQRTTASRTLTICLGMKSNNHRYQRTIMARNTPRSTASKIPGEDGGW
jgi:hypothetical protein